MFVSPPDPCRKNVHQRLDPAAVRAEVELLQQLCNEGEMRALESVRYTSGLNYLPRFTGRQEKHLLLTTMLFNRKLVQCRFAEPTKSRHLIILVTVSFNQNTTLTRFKIQ